MVQSNKKPSKPPASTPFPLNELIVISLYIVAILTVYAYSSNWILFFVYAGAIGAASWFLQSQLAIYTVVGIVAGSVLLSSVSTAVTTETPSV